MTTNLSERSNVVSRAEWAAARKELLIQEKQLKTNAVISSTPTPPTGGETKWWTLPTCIWT